MTDEEIIKAFHVMWGNFPEPVIVGQLPRTGYDYAEKPRNDSRK